MGLIVFLVKVFIWVAAVVAAIILACFTVYLIIRFFRIRYLVHRGEAILLTYVQFLTLNREDGRTYNLRDMECNGVVKDCVYLGNIDWLRVTRFKRRAQKNAEHKIAVDATYKNLKDMQETLAIAIKKGQAK